MPKKIYECFPEGKFKALTMSYDDGMKEDIPLIEIFNKYKIKGTFHLNSGLMTQPERILPEQIKQVYKGHEVAAHTLTHPTIARSPMELVTEQILQDRKELEHLIGIPVRGFSYPNGSYNESIKQLLPHLGIRYARVVGSSDQFGLPRDFYEWQATCHHNHNLLKNTETFLELFKKQYLYLMYVWGHSFEFSRDKNWNLIEEFCNMIGNREDIWYATNIEIVDYQEAFLRLQFSADASFVYNPSACSVWLSVDDTVIEVLGGELKQL